MQFLASTLSSSYNYTYSSTSSTGSSITLVIFFIIAIIVFYLVGSFILGKIFQKANRPMWAGFVPVYSSWVLMEISGKPGWWALFALIPYLGSLIFLILYIIAMLELAKRFGKSTLFAVFGLIIFSIIGLIMLAFGKSTYNAVPDQSGGFAGPSPMGPNTFGPSPNGSDTPQVPTAPSTFMPPQPIVSAQPQQNATVSPSITPNPNTGVATTPMPQSTPEGVSTAPVVGGDMGQSVVAQDQEQNVESAPTSPVMPPTTESTQPGVDNGENQPPVPPQGPTPPVVQ